MTIFLWRNDFSRTWVWAVEKQIPVAASKWEGNEQMSAATSFYSCAAFDEGSLTEWNI